MTRDPKYCASCAAFPLAASVKAGGVAPCAIRQQPQGWNDRACVLYERAKDVSERREIFITLEKDRTCAAQ